MQNTDIFDTWNQLKKNLDTTESGVAYFKQGQVWWCSIGKNIGSEVLGKGATFTRPVLVFRKLSNNAFLGIPFTTHLHEGSWYVRIQHKGIVNTLMLHQARVYDKKRLVDRFGELDDEDFALVREAFMSLYCS